MPLQDETRRKVTVLTNGYQIMGECSVLPGARVTDYLNDSRDFIALTNASVWHVADARKMMNAAFLNLNRGNVEIIVPN